MTRRMPGRVLRFRFTNDSRGSAAPWREVPKLRVPRVEPIDHLLADLIRHQGEAESAARTARWWFGWVWWLHEPPPVPRTWGQLVLLVLACFVLGYLATGR